MNDEIMIDDVKYVRADSIAAAEVDKKTKLDFSLFHLRKYGNEMFLYYENDEILKITASGSIKRYASTQWNDGKDYLSLESSAAFSEDQKFKVIKIENDY